MTARELTPEQVFRAFELQLISKAEARSLLGLGDLGAANLPPAAPAEAPPVALQATAQVDATPAARSRARRESSRRRVTPAERSISTELEALSGTVAAPTGEAVVHHLDAAPAWLQENLSAYLASLPADQVARQAAALDVLLLGLAGQAFPEPPRLAEVEGQMDSIVRGWNEQLRAADERGQRGRAHVIDHVLSSWATWCNEDVDDGQARWYQLAEAWLHARHPEASDEQLGLVGESAAGRWLGLPPGTSPDASPPGP